MKSLLPIGLLCLLISCAKNNEEPTATVELKEKETCTFGIENFNLIKREPLNDEQMKPPKTGGNGGGNGGGSGGGGTSGGTTGGGTTTPPATTGGGVILLDFDGQLVAGTAWNSNGDFYAAPANIVTADMAQILDRVTNDYSPFNITVTLDENVYNAAPLNKRMRVIITESWEWYGQVGGVAYIGSFTSGTNTPCFVFSSLLYYNPKYIAEAVSHEAGHTFGLYHQALYNGCTITSSYNSGIGYGEEISWAPLMGAAYSQNLSLWHYGPSTASCTSYQDEVSRIASIVGFRTDDHVNNISGATALSSSAGGLINTSNDEDFFVINTSTPRTVSLVPYNTGVNNSGSNTDLVLKVYNSQGSLLYSVNDPSVLHAVTSINAGTYYISVGTAPNVNTNTYGMLGKYTVSLF